jgi:predicted membrane channel-forming protein YqfA (hemolysin III family)
MAPAHCMPNCWCEAVRWESLIRQPANVWSNISMFVVAAIVLWLSKQRSDQNLLTANPNYSRLYAAGLILTGLGSMFFHASLTHVGQWVDLLGMYFLATVLYLYNYSRLKPLKTEVLLTAYFIFVGIFAILMYALPEVNDILFGVLILTFVIFVIWTQRKLKTKVKLIYIILGIIAYYGGSTLWILDKEHKLCEPQSLLQGHAAWHLLSAAATLFVYLFFRSEKKRAPN